MHLQRVQVPDFRALKNVDITFEKDFTHRIFPLESLNGGGKSTLLQLIFVLLHCAGNPERHEAIKNLLYGFKVESEDQTRTLAKFEIIDQDKIFHLDFFICHDSYPQYLLQTGTDEIDLSLLRFSHSLNPISLDNPYEIDNPYQIDKLEQKVFDIVKSIDLLQNLRNASSEEERTTLIEALERLSRSIIIVRELLDHNTRYSYIDEYIYVEKLTELNNYLNKHRDFLMSYKTDHALLEESGLTLREHYSAQNLVYICSYTQDSVGSETMAVICQISDMDFVGKNKLKPQQIFLSELSNKFFINAPQTQIFLFLPKQVKYSLFKERQELDYKRSLQLYQKNLTNFFVYEFIPISFIIKTFKTMRDLDFKEAVRTGGNYGQNYKNLFYSLSNLLGGKQVTLSDDLSSIIFTKNINGKEIELGPEDLSHGELKRLSLYLWLKYTNIQDSIVLMDEIELALHPDWQYQIVQDLMEWAPSNQYILATHSYAVCEALTPAHVKGLEPRLTPPTTPNPSESP